MGRPSRLNPQLQEAILQALRSGMTINETARAADIAPRTFRDWMAKGAKATSGQYRDFYDAVQRERARTEQAMLLVIQKAARGYEATKTRTVTERRADGSTVTTTTIETQNRFEWTAAAWWLERSFPQRWGRQDRVAALANPEPAEVPEVAREELADELEAFLAARDDQPAREST